MNIVKLFTPLMILTLELWGQSPIDQALERYNSGVVPYVSTDLALEWQQKDSVIFLDTRAFKEFQVSHIPGAKFVGYDEFDTAKIKRSKQQDTRPIVVYCSIGVRSEQIGHKLIQLGFKQVYNLYGGIFLWHNQGKDLFDSDNLPTRDIHGYDQNWAKYIKGGTPTF